MGAPAFQQTSCQGRGRTRAAHAQEFASQLARLRRTTCAAAHELRRREPSDQAGAAGVGKVTVNALPLPSSLETSIRPPWASTIRRVM
jgi:hypothetical protein